ncbi:RNA-directed DNA polymerase, eukaryota [Tanacetum coccineum]
MLNKLPSRVNRRGIDVDSILSPICLGDLETVNHFFFNCVLAKDLWHLLAKWWEMDIPVCGNFADWFDWLDSLYFPIKVRLVLKGVGGTLMWSIWNFRNSLIFSSCPPKKEGYPSKSISNASSLNAFGFGSRWRSWIQGSLNSGKASVLVNGSPTLEFEFHRGLKQGDPLAPFLFILIMESLHLSFNRAVEAGIFTGLRIDDALTISHLFYADDAIFIGEWSKENLKGILNILNCFSLLSGMSINLKKSHILGLGIRGSIVSEAAASLGCSVMKTPFNYLGIMVGGNMSLVKSWDETVHKLTKRLSKWKLKTLSIGGRLTLLKSVLGSTPIYNMSIFKVPKTVLNKMENLRRNFFQWYSRRIERLRGLSGILFSQLRNSEA